MLLHLIRGIERIVIQQIRGIDILVNDVDDSFYWGLHSSGNFITKSTTWLAHQSKLLRGLDWEHK